jgi:hypothetical protein
MEGVFVLVERRGCTFGVSEPAPTEISDGASLPPRGALAVADLLVDIAEGVILFVEKLYVIVSNAGLSIPARS